MNKTHGLLEERIRLAAQAFVFPPTPDLSQRVRDRIEKKKPVLHLVRAVVLILIIVSCAVVAVPETRAALIGYFRIGAVQILPSLPEQNLQPGYTASEKTDFPTALVGLAGRMSLEEALSKAAFPVLLPTYPVGLGEPEDVFFQQGFPMVVMAWRSKDEPQRISLCLYQIGSDSILATKFGVEPEVVQETSVGQSEALWVKGPYLLQLTNGSFELRRLVEGYTLIWEREDITYRLETDLPLNEALKVAESLR